MGGYNSSRWHHYTRKLTVEECEKLRVNDFHKLLLEKRCEAGTPVYCGESYPVVYAWLKYRLVLERIVPDQAVKREPPLGQAFQVARTACHYGDWRYWLVCPGCQRRCGALYNRSDPEWYACRKCHDLTYASSLEARKSAGHGARARYLARARRIERKLEKVKRWRKRARKLEAQMKWLHQQLGWSWRWKS
jgi:hypothetical protein